MPAVFLEVQFPPRISLEAEGGPGYSTTVVTSASGREARNRNWSQARLAWQVGHVPKLEAEWAPLLAFFRAAGGRAAGFRFKDWTDFRVSLGEGLLQPLDAAGQPIGTPGLGYGVPAYQLVKRYTFGAYSDDRTIRKPVAGSVTLQQAGSGVTFGGGAGQAALDAATGIVTFQPAASQTISAVTVGATTQVTLAAALSPLAIGDRLYLTGLTGADAELLNNASHAITNVAGAVYTVSTNTTGKTITPGSGVGRRYPRVTDALAWAGEFDVPARFDTDRMLAATTARTQAGLRITWQAIPIVEIPV
jgi:uncharacterized protein (TIGR02217 family)